jgi:parallel beta-helix repeat protein
LRQNRKVSYFFIFLLLSSTISLVANFEKVKAVDSSPAWNGNIVGDILPYIRECFNPSTHTFDWDYPEGDSARYTVFLNSVNQVNAIREANRDASILGLTASQVVALLPDLWALLKAQAGYSEDMFSVLQSLSIADPNTVQTMVSSLDAKVTSVSGEIGGTSFTSVSAVKDWVEVRRYSYTIEGVNWQQVASTLQVEFDISVSRLDVAMSLWDTANAIYKNNYVIGDLIETTLTNPDSLVQKVKAYELNVQNGMLASDIAGILGNTVGTIIGHNLGLTVGATIGTAFSASFPPAPLVGAVAGYFVGGYIIGEGLEVAAKTAADLLADLVLGKPIIDYLNELSIPTVSARITSIYTEGNDLIVATKERIYVTVQNSDPSSFPARTFVVSVNPSEWSVTDYWEWSLFDPESYDLDNTKSVTLQPGQSGTVVFTVEPDDVQSQDLLTFVLWYQKGWAWWDTSMLEVHTPVIVQKQQVIRTLSLSISSDKDTYEVGVSGTLTATLVDQDFAAVDSASVVYSIKDLQGVSFSNGVLTGTGNGQYQTVFSVPQSPNSYQIVVTATKTGFSNAPSVSKSISVMRIAQGHNLKLVTLSMTNIYPSPGGSTGIKVQVNNNGQYSEAVTAVIAITGPNSYSFSTNVGLGTLQPGYTTGEQTIYYWSVPSSPPDVYYTITVTAQGAQGDEDPSDNTKSTSVYASSGVEPTYYAYSYQWRAPTWNDNCDLTPYGATFVGAYGPITYYNPYNGFTYTLAVWAYQMSPPRYWIFIQRSDGQIIWTPSLSNARTLDYYTYFDNYFLMVGVEMVTENQIWIKVGSPTTSATVTPFLQTCNVNSQATYTVNVPTQSFYYQPFVRRTIQSPPIITKEQLSWFQTPYTTQGGSFAVTARPTSSGTTYFAVDTDGPISIGSDYPTSYLVFGQLNALDVYDAALTSLDISPTSPKSGDTVTIKNVIADRGTAPVTGITLNTVVTGPSNYIKSFSATNVVAGETDFTWDTTGCYQGTYNIASTIVSGLDSDSSNNAASKSFNLEAPPPPPDMTAPETSLNLAASVSTSGNIDFSWTGSDDVTAPENLVFSYRINEIDANWSPWISETTKQYNNLQDGTYTFQVKAKDQAENQDPTPAEWSFRVDATPPTITEKNCTGTDVVIQNVVVRVVFSESMNHESTENAFSINPYVPGTFTWQADTLFFTAFENLAYSTVYTIQLDKRAMDVAGNPLSSVVAWQFTTINPPLLFDFDVDSGVATRTVTVGGSTTYPVTVTLLSGSTESITLSCSPPITGVEYTFNPSANTPTFASTLTVQTSSNTPLDTYTLTITGTSSELTHTCNVELIVQAPGLVVPTDGMVITENTVLAPGTYNLPNGIKIGASNIVLDGNGAVLNGAGTQYVTGITTSQPQTDLTIKNCVVQNYWDGIIICAPGSSILNNHVTNCGHVCIGVYGQDVTETYNCVIANNYVAGNPVYPRHQQQRGIDVGVAYNCIVANNTATNCWQKGFFFFNIHDSSFYNNTAVDNGDGYGYGYGTPYGYGFELGSFSNNLFFNNSGISNDCDGIYALYTVSYNVFVDNVLSDNGRSGFFLNSGPSNNVILNNTMKGSAFGVILQSEGTAANSIAQNEIFDNTNTGIIISGSGNTIYHNNFRNNPTQAADSLGTNIWYNTTLLEGNYWNDYAGVDANQDGIGDTPYAIGVNIADNYPLMNPWTNQKIASLVVRGSNNVIYLRTYNYLEKSWSSWTGLPGSTPDSPAAAVINNELHLVVRGMNGGQIWHGYVNLRDGSFSGFTLLSGSTPSAPTLTGNSTHLCLVVRGNNNVIYYRFYNVATRVWGDWTGVPNGSTFDTPAAVLIDNKLQVVVRGSNNNQIWHGIVDLGSGGFSGWTLLDGATPSPPVLTRNSTHLCLVVRGKNNVIYYRWYDLASETWGGWTGFPYGSTPDVPAATIVGDSLQIVVRGMNHDQIWHGTLNMQSNEWSGWTLLDGTTPSKPVLTS